MKKIYFILFTLVFVFWSLGSQEQNTRKLNFAVLNQSAAQADPFNKPGHLLYISSVTGGVFPGDCPNQITVDTDDGTVLCDFLNASKETEVIKTGNDDCGAWGPYGDWGPCEYGFRARRRTKNCSRTDVLQDKHVCNYIPNVAWVGMVGTATSTHFHGGRYNNTYNWEEEDFEYDFCLFGSLSTDLNNALATVTSGKEIQVNYSGGKASLMKGSSLVVTEDVRIVWDKSISPQITSVSYTVDGRALVPGQNVSMNDAGLHTIMANINTKSGGIVKFNMPFTVIKPVTVEEITQQALNNGAKQFDIKIMNNNTFHPGSAWVSISGLSNPGYVAEITGSKQYDLKPGSSALISIILRPSAIRRINPANPEAVSFDLIVSSPGANGLMNDKKTITAQSAAMGTPGGTAGIDGPQQIRTISVKTLSGEVVDVKIPNNIRPGDHISGSAVTNSQSSTLEGAVIDIENNRTGLKDKIFKFIVPAGITSLPFLLKNAKGETLGMTEIPVNAPNIPTPGGNITIPVQQIRMPPQHSAGNYAPMNYCQPGDPLTINGFFDGNASNTKVSINNIPCEIIAESDRGAFARIPAETPGGRQTLTISEQGVTESIPIQVVTTNLTANKKVVQKNTRAKATITVSGLENLDLNNNNFRVDLTNGSPNTIQFRNAAGNTLSWNLTTENVKNGTFTATADIQGIAVGSYTVSSNLTSTTCTDCWKQYEACIAKVEADEKQCYKDCDKANAGTSCYLACSAAARLQEAECFAAYLGCVRKKLGF